MFVVVPRRADRYDIGFPWRVDGSSSVILEIEGVDSTGVVVVDKGVMSTIVVEEDSGCSSFGSGGIGCSRSDIVSFDGTTGDEVISDEVDGLEMDVDEIE